MLFTSSTFIFIFAPLFFVVYFIIYQINRAYLNTFIIFSSLTFYAYGSGYFILIVIFTLYLDYILGNYIYILNHKKWFLILDILMNISILFYYKYFNFFMDNINVLNNLFFCNNILYENVILPIGISFIVFQKITYCCDIYKNNIKPAKNFFYLLQYLFLFPQIIAGPIVQYKQIATQFENITITLQSFMLGFSRFVLGLFKKIYIADVLARVADTCFSGNESGVIPFDYAWLGLITYTFQIYFDFSGYSDMAIGLLTMMGFTIPENFNQPYTALSISDFWKRWHISMTSWFREYLYFPLGGNRHGKARTYINLWIVFLLSGFWHGASWNFIVWGIYHGGLLSLERTKLWKKLCLPSILSRLLTFFLVMIGWIFFRSNTLTSSFNYIYNMFNFHNFYVHVVPEYILILDNFFYFIFIVALLYCFLPISRYYCKIIVRIKENFLYYIFVFVIFFLCLIKSIAGTESPFIYFRF